jgi:NADH-quinone oxidoreductase subunit L
MDHHVAQHVHESPGVMTVPLLILAGLSLLGGLILGFPPENGMLHHFLAPVATAHGAEEHHGFGMVDFALMVGSVLIAIGGWWLAYTMYVRKPEMADAWAEKYRNAHRLLLNKYWVDELYDFLVVEPSKRLGVIWDWFDHTVIDGAVRGVARMTQGGAWLSTWIEKYILYGFLNVVGYSNHLGARAFRLLQTGFVHHYAFIVIIGLAILVYVLWWWSGGDVGSLLAQR